MGIDKEKITRIEIIGEVREYVKVDIKIKDISMQDDGGTMKILLKSDDLTKYIGRKVFAKEDIYLEGNQEYGEIIAIDNKGKCIVSYPEMVGEVFQYNFSDLIIKD